MRADQVVSLYRDMEANGIELWLLGGWGVDALLGRQTRQHHDLDVLVELSTLERSGGGSPSSASSSRTSGRARTRGSATSRRHFVYAHPDGHEIDTHVVRREADGTFAMLWTAPHAIASLGLAGLGVVDGCAVRCLTADAQRVAHTGYELPPHHLADMELLGGLEPGL
jgi:lincosamide nucleotidyltransferase A/C/D/E